MNLDLIGIAESHLKGSKVLEVDGYQWYGNNREDTHKRTYKGSGGVGVFVRKSLYTEFDITNLYDKTEGILWIELHHKLTKERLRLCVCYLPPGNSSRNINAEDYFNTLMYNIYEFQNDSLITVCGDFNARIGDNDDFIAGVDTLPERDIIDFTKNQYCDIFTDFLISTNMCILNGRNSKKNNYTSVSAKGSAVVDYVLVPYEHLCKYNNFEVILSADALQNSFDIQTLEHLSIPDHSLLVWEVSFNTSIQNVTKEELSNAHYTHLKYDKHNIPTEFMCENDILTKINNSILELEQNQNQQAHINNVYSSFTDILKDEMNKFLNPRIVVIDGTKNKKRRTKKPWWNEELSQLWNDLCTSEKLWLKCKNSSEKAINKQLYINKRKHFDRCIQRRKRQYWIEKQNELLNACENSDIFWKTIGKTGIGNERSKEIPMEVTLENGERSNTIEDILLKWKTEFEKLYNSTNPTNTPNNYGDPNVIYDKKDENDILNSGISILDVRKAIRSLHKNKTAGYDGIPAEVLQSDTCIHFLHRLFCVCFETGKIPEAWNYGIITPLLKDPASDARNPMNYRGITVTSSVYKAYCNVLNHRLTRWAEQEGKLTDFQNGFREKRSTIDHLSTITSIIENRKFMKKSTYIAFVDFSKAYDTINRELLWTKLQSHGINGKILQSLQSLYQNVKCSVKVNHFKTDWFDVKSGLKQGCILSTLLFNLYLNDLSNVLSTLNKGIVVDNSCINHLCYADDLILIADTEQDLQYLLDILAVWCNENCMTVNFKKTNVIQFRNQSVARSAFQFTCGDLTIEYTDKYKYLGLVLNEHLDYSVTAKYVAQAATRALGLLLSKFKQSGGMPHDVFKKLFDTTVWSVISYGAAIWGTKEYSAINTVQNKACRFFLGVGKYTPNAAANGDVGWIPPHIKQMKTVLSHWFRLNHMETERVNKRVFLWSHSTRHTYKNWCFQVDKILQKLNISLNIDNFYNKSQRQSITESLQDTMFAEYKVAWKCKVESNSSISKNNGGNKLRTYKLFKNSYETEDYVKNHLLSRTRRSSLAKFRCGVAPLRIETGRYERISYDERNCFNCKTKVENEEHALLECPLYDDIRNELFSKIEMSTFELLNTSDKVAYLLSDSRICNYTAKACHDILNKRRKFLYR